MLTLDGQREIATVKLYRDDVDPLSWYTMPQFPRVALDDAGKPLFSLLWYRRDLSAVSEADRLTKLGGGVLAMTVELAYTPDQEKQIRQQLAADPALHARLEQSDGTRRWWVEEAQRDESKLAAKLALSSVPVSDGKVTIAILAEQGGTAGNDFVSQLVGVGRASMLGNERTAFQAKLTQDGAVLLWKALEKDLPTIYVGYDFTFSHRLNAVRMVVQADASKAYHVVQEQWDRINDDASWSEWHSGGSSTYTFSHDKSTDARDRLFATVTDAQVSHVDIIPEAPLPPEEETELLKMGNELLSNFLSATFLDFDPTKGFEAAKDPDLTTKLAELDGKEYGHYGIQYYHLKQFDQSMQASLYHEYKAQHVLEWHVLPNDNLGNIAQGHDLGELRTQIELNDDYYRYMDVEVLCTTDFDHDPVDLVTATLRYQGTAPTGPIDTVKTFSFAKGKGPALFSTYLAARDQRQYEYELTIHYKGSTATYTTTGKTDATELVLDTDTLGVLHVDGQTGIVDWTRVKAAQVRMTWGSGADAREARFTLDAQHQNFTWVEALGRAVDGPYTCEVTWVDMDDQRLSQDPIQARSRQLVINYPFEQSLEVLVVPAGSFGGEGLLSRVNVALRYEDANNGYRIDDTISLTKDGDAQTWRVPLRDKGLRTYKYQVTVIYNDGVVREDEWRSTDKTILTVGDPFGFRVRILPRLLNLGATKYLFGTVSLRFDDAQEGIHAEKTLEIADFNTPLTWRFRLASPDRHTYRYSMRLFTADGTPVDVPEAQTDTEVLVLQPPAPSPAPN
jgi:hypothetical protein